MGRLWVNQRGITIIELLAIIVILGILSSIAAVGISKLVEDYRVKAEKANAIVVIKAASMFFIYYEEENGYEINSVGVPTLIAMGYLQDEGLGNDSFWVAEEEGQTWICGMSYRTRNQVEFRKATIQNIQDSGKGVIVGTQICGDMSESM